MNWQQVMDARYERDPETIRAWWGAFLMTAEGYAASMLGPSRQWGRFLTYLRREGLREVRYPVFRAVVLDEDS